MKRAPSLRKFAAAPHLVWSVLFIIAPLLFVAYYAFTDSTGAFTLSNIAALTSANYRMTFMRSISYSLIATVICLVIAYPVAYIIARSRKHVQGTLIMLIMLPMWMNLLIRTYSWMAIIQDTGFLNEILNAVGLPKIHIINTPGAVVLGMVYNYLPYMILPIYSVIVKIDHRLIEAAKDLGASGLQVLTKITLPLSISGIISGITMVFVPSISTFYISQKLGGGNYDMIGDAIERQFMSNYNYNLGAAMSFVLMILILLCMALMNRFSDDDAETGGMII
ncbi:MAG: ABC transporter permease [Clostridiales bacterium]|nr:ABC transporter permease [Clostridiales bacterium]